MAKVKFGAIVTDMRNKLGSTVFSRNRYGAYSRSFKSTLSSSTSYQVDVRNRLATISALWKTLSEDQRNAWNNAVSLFTTTDVFGDIIRPSGLDLFVKLNCNFDQIGTSPFYLPPLPATVPSLSSLSITANSADPLLQVDFDATNFIAGDKVIWMATDCISPGKSYIKNLVRQIQVDDIATTSPIDLTSAYLAKFGAITEAKRISLQAICVSGLSGQKSKPFNCTTIVSGGSPPPSNECVVDNYTLTPSSGQCSIDFDSVTEVNVDYYVINAGPTGGSLSPITAFPATGPGSHYNYVDFEAPGNYDYSVDAYFLDSSSEQVAYDGVVIP